MLQPKRTKYRKTQKGRNEGLAYAGSIVSFGEFGLKATSRGQITAREIEAARRAFTREMKREGKVWILCSQTSQSLRKLLVFVWVKVKVLLSTGLLQFSLVVYFSKSVALVKKLLVRLSVLLQQNYL